MFGGDAKESVGKMLWFAFLGGIILNIMPCVFPVIALKILGFVNQSKEDPKRVLHLGVIYSLGVVASFLVMAGAVIAVQQAGKSASWGMQMQNPQFTTALTVLMTLVALNLFGVFEVTLGAAVNAAGGVTQKEGASGAFFNGVLAVVLATPCTAPFLAPALGFAFSQPPALIVLFFVAVGAGLALPYLVLSAQPKWIRILPRPGAWMEKFKVAMGFPMLATAIWLFSFTAKRFGPDGPLWLALFLVVVALAAWVFGEFVQRGTQRRGLAAVICILLLGGGYAKALEGELNWRKPVKKSSGDAIAENKNSDAPDALVWRKWSADAVAKARAEGRVVLVDFTADWCLTCKANLRTSIDITSTRKRLKELNAVTLIGDNTDEDPAIITELKKFGRAGVPLVLVYPKDASKPPLVLPAFLTPGIVHDALAEAAK
ncbi:MAG: thioredoxin family protein [Verrucomicrobia bacterium]|nr:thioredoxin family protein [Verrucomicrobiota bacterium]